MTLKIEGAGKVSLSNFKAHGPDGQEYPSAFKSIEEMQFDAAGGISKAARTFERTLPFIVPSGAAVSTITIEGVTLPLASLEKSTRSAAPKTAGERVERGRRIVADRTVFPVPLPAVDVAQSLGENEAEQHIQAWGVAPLVANMKEKYGEPDRSEERSAVGPDKFDLVISWYGEYGLGAPNPKKYPPNHSAVGRVVFVDWKRSSNKAK